jgi:hypothetical protein
MTNPERLWETDMLRDHQALTQVFHWKSGKLIGRWALPPHIAVMCAYAQDKCNNFDITTYDELYKHLVKLDRSLVFCGEYYTFIRKFYHNGKLKSLETKRDARIRRFKKLRAKERC